jgi:NodT family efflux transporter outer membrane factor (OMF) lipoprotein
MSSCSVGPNYQRPSAPVPLTYKEQQDWKIAAPNDTIKRGAWWSIYRDPVLDQLERQVNVSNQNIKQVEAAVRQARAQVREQQSSYFPSLSVTSQAQRLGTSNTAIPVYSVTGTATWEPDFWGKIRRTVESSAAGAQATAAQLAGAQLSAQAEVATDYFELRFSDSLKDLLTETVKSDERALTITQNQYSAGVVARSDVINAQAQLLSAQAQLVSSGLQRAQLEHAIAVLTGRPPTDISIPVGRLPDRIPIVPTSVPSALLERRPDIAQAERQMQEQSALIGVQISTYFPTINLSAAAGYTGNVAANLFSPANAVWSLVANGAETILSGGQRRASVEAARATYDESVANYRQVVLAAFQNVEDELAALRILEQQIVVQTAAIAAAQHALDITLNEYQAGTVAYTAVITAQLTLLSDQETALQVQQNRLIASVALVQALGGGWDSSQLPSIHDLQRVPVPIPD